MVATLLKLRGRLLVNSLKRETWRLVFTLLGVAYGLGVMVLLAVGAFFLRDADPGGKAIAVLAGGIVLTLGWAIVPLVAFGVDDSLDPARFALFTVPSRGLALGLVLAGAISLPALFIGLGLALTTLVWTTSPFAALSWIVAAPIGLATGLLLARVTTTAASTWLRSRRGRDLVGVAALVAFFGVLLIPSLGERLDWAAIAAALEPAARVLSWTPFGAAWAVTGEVASGSVGTAAAHLAVALAWVGLLMWAWTALLGRAMLSAPEARALKRRTTTGGYTLPDRLAATLRLPMPAAAVAARCFRYWRSDPRYLSMAAGNVLVAPVVVIALGMTREDGPGGIALAAPIIFALFAGWSMHDDTAYDSTALWMQISAGTSGVHDRIGRAVAALAWLVPLGVAFGVGACALAGRWEALPAILGGTLGIILGGMGVSMVASGALVYPVQPPGASPFSTNGMGSIGLVMLAQTATGIATFVLSVPVVVTMLLGLFLDPAWGWVALVLGPAVGIGALVAGVRIGGRSLEARAPRHLQAIRGWAGH